MASAAQPADQGGEQHHAGADDIVAAVRAAGLQGLRTDSIPDFFVKQRHPELDREGQRQHDDGQHPELRQGGVPDLIHRGQEQFEAGGHDQGRHPQGGEVFHPAVAEGVLGIRLLSRQLEAHQRHER